MGIRVSSLLWVMQDLGVSENRAPKCSTLNSRNPNYKDPKMRCPNFRKIPYIYIYIYIYIYTYIYIYIASVVYPKP